MRHVSIFWNSTADRVLTRDTDALEHIIAAAMPVFKAEVVDTNKAPRIRRIFDFGQHGSAMPWKPSSYERFLHGEGVAFGMHAATRLAGKIGWLRRAGRRVDSRRWCAATSPIPALDGIQHDLVARLGSNKNPVQGKVNFVLPTRIGEVKIIYGIDPATIRAAIESMLFTLRFRHDSGCDFRTTHGSVSPDRPRERRLKAWRSGDALGARRV